VELGHGRDARCLPRPRPRGAPRLGAEQAAWPEVRTGRGMIGDPKFIALGEGILALLVVFSLIGFALAKTAESDAARATIANLNARIRAWWVMAIVLSAAIAGGRVLTLVLF